MTKHTIQADDRVEYRTEDFGNVVGTVIRIEGPERTGTAIVRFDHPYTLPNGRQIIQGAVPVTAAKYLGRKTW